MRASIAAAAGACALRSVTRPCSTTEGFFARSGTLVLREDPFNQRLDATLRDVILEEVTIAGPALESVPVPGGRCLALVETTVTSSFPTAGWRCPTEQFDDGERCHCSCGAYDPDCAARAFPASGARSS